MAAVMEEAVAAMAVEMAMEAAAVVTGAVAEEASEETVCIMDEKINFTVFLIRKA